MTSHDDPSTRSGVPATVRGRGRSTGARLAALVLIATFCVVGAPTLASAKIASTAAKLTSYTSDVRVNRDGTLRVSETWRAGGGGDTVDRQVVTRWHLPDDVDHVVEISNVKAVVAGDPSATGGTPAAVSALADGDVTTLSVSVPARRTPATVKVTYDVRGAVAATSVGTELRWTPLHGLDELAEARITLSSPQIDYIRCTAGPLDGSMPCTLAQMTESAPIFEQRGLSDGGSVTIVAGFPPGQVAPSTVVAYRKSFRRAFLTEPTQLGVTAVVLALGAAGLYLLHRRRGRDPIETGRVVPASFFRREPGGTTTFSPPQDLRPGEVGTLIDERVDPVDVTSTILDLAVRGHLRITELPKPNEFARSDWTLTRAATTPDELKRYEQRLLDGIFVDGAAEVKVSELGGRVRTQLGAIQDALYDEVVANGWFAERPDRSRSTWTAAGIGVLVAGVLLTVGLAFFTTWGLLGLAVTAIGAGLTVLGQHMPAKAPAAGRVIGQVASLRGELLELDPDELPAVQHVDLCARALPYAVVLGGSERWIDALVATDVDDEPDEGFSWYSGPANWHLQHLPDSLKNLTTSLTGALFAR
ncbi:DUF2207 domain-containing protein [Actinopolymorpha alba]|uniref:DUF2207 domain-containing protein n=1 Tax=Actinopolymorpha alba TaxID=533267 RepID=UPI0003671B7A|nr:DUF2207 domain-containing protein [Actinopolymorpha alba]